MAAINFTDTIKPIFGIPKEILDGIGVDGELVQSVIITFNNESFCSAEIKLIPDAPEEMVKLFADHIMILAKK